MQVLTNSEKLLLSSVGVFAISLTAIVIFCVVRKSCLLHKAIWEDDKKKKQRMDDIICIRYPPDIYPTSLGVYRENAFRSPEEELARLFYSPIKRDSTYSSMSDRSSNSSVGLEMSSPHTSSGSNTTTMGSPVTAVAGTPEEQSPRHSSAPRQGNNAAVNVKSLSNVKSSSPMVPVPVVPIPIAGHVDQRFSMPHFSNSTGFYRSTVAALAEEAAVAANRRFSLQPGMSLSHPNARQPFFTFILKYEEDNGLINIEFIEARNLPQKEYLAQPSDAFFTLEIQPRKPADRKKDVLRYRFVTRTIKKAGEICDFSETFLAQLAKSHLNEYVIKFTAFDQDRFGNPNEIGTTTLSFEDFKDFTSNKLVLSCSLKEPLSKRGDIMLGMCYLPTAERMSVTIVKLNNLNPFFTDGMISKQSKADFLVCTLQFAVFISDLYVKNGLQFITRDLSCKWFR
ncbi:Synaptotagmin-10 [Folsomia candida]|uniref:Synaptotagmin-10 n=1 Tax=Folsomia candida TaxID=158441 RepID=A0A226EIT1_FOLCA|nr:Synaptotagmin-10 [Folsomia candida]